MDDKERNLKGTLVLEGRVSLKEVEKIASERYDLIDLSKAEWTVEKEKWATYMWSHCGSILTNSGIRDVEVLVRFLETAQADTVILPDNVMRRHVNRLAANPEIKVAKVASDCRLFSMNGDVLMNKKGTSIVYDPDIKKGQC